jgi:hypothetical protein
MMNAPRIAVGCRVAVGDRETPSYDEGTIREIEGGPFARGLVEWNDETRNWIQLSLLEEP